MKAILKDAWFVAAILMIIVAALVMTGCTQLNALAVDENDNAMACIKGSSGATSGVLNGSVSGVTVELPAGVDTSTWTADDWRILAEICD